jgi:hypothetical protein
MRRTQMRHEPFAHVNCGDWLDHAWAKARTALAMSMTRQALLPDLPAASVRAGCAAMEIGLDHQL